MSFILLTTWTRKDCQAQIIIHGFNSLEEMNPKSIDYLIRYLRITEECLREDKPMQYLQLAKEFNSMLGSLNK